MEETMTNLQVAQGVRKMLDRALKDFTKKMDGILALYDREWDIPMAIALRTEEPVKENGNVEIKITGGVLLLPKRS